MFSIIILRSWFQMANCWSSQALKMDLTSATLWQSKMDFIAGKWSCQTLLNSFNFLKPRKSTLKNSFAITPECIIRSKIFMTQSIQYRIPFTHNSNFNAKSLILRKAVRLGFYFWVVSMAMTLQASPGIPNLWLEKTLTHMIRFIETKIQCMTRIQCSSRGRVFTNIKSKLITRRS